MDTRIHMIIPIMMTMKVRSADQYGLASREYYCPPLCLMTF